MRWTKFIRVAAIPCVVLVIGIAFAFCFSCSRQLAEPGAGQDYQQMLERVRKRNAVEQARRDITRSIEEFQVDFGRLPTNLFELVSFDYLNEIPTLSGGLTYRYDPLLGRVSVMKSKAPPDKTSQ